MSGNEFAQILDNPSNINAFLAMIGGTPIDEVAKVKVKSSTQVGSISRVEDAGDPKINQGTVGRNADPHHDDVQVNPDSGTSTPKVDSRAQSVASSPATAGIRAPPTTPAARAITAENSTTLEPIEEDGSEILTRLADESSLRLDDSNFANQRHVKPVSNPFNTSSPKTKFDASFPLVGKNRKMNMTGSQAEMVEKMAKLKEVKGYEESVLSAFRQKHRDSVEGQKENQAPMPQAQPATMKALSLDLNHVRFSDTVPFPTFEEPPVNHGEKRRLSVPDVLSHVKVTQDTQPLSKISVNERDLFPSTPSSATSADPTTPDRSKMLMDGARNYDQALERARAELASKVADQASTQGSPTIVVTCTTDEDSHPDKEEEDRENLKHFKQWGQPVSRDKPRSCVRKVVLTGLPLGADLTLVQSLISGGAIETFAISPIGQTAYVTFTTGEACDKFYAKYPNGIVFKHRGKTHTVFVDKAGDVDIVSGMLQGYLDCGASRCVRAVGADEDWGIRALQKLAEGAKGSRRVENIIDTYRNGVRAVLFRFASISDAVRFKTMLVRDEDWEACNIQFVDDPCEKAVDLHLE